MFFLCLFCEQDLLASPHWSFSDSITVSDAKKWVEYPFLAMSANDIAYAKTSVWTEPNVQDIFFLSTWVYLHWRNIKKEV